MAKIRAIRAPRFFRLTFVFGKPIADPPLAKNPMSGHMENLGDIGQVLKISAKNGNTPAAPNAPTQEANTQWPGSISILPVWLNSGGPKAPPEGIRYPLIEQGDDGSH